MVITAEHKHALTDWEQKSEALAKAVRDELDARERVVGMYFPAKHEGTMNVDLGDGTRLKGEFKNSYKLDKEKTPGVLAALPKALRDNLVKWDPRLSVTAYRALEPAHRTIVDTVVTMTPSRPSLKVEEIKRR